MIGVTKMYMSSSEVAAMIGLRVRTVRELTRRELLPGRKIGGRVLYKIDEVHAALAVNKTIDARSGLAHSTPVGTSAGRGGAYE